jgi:hypothetical protein
MKNQVWQVIKMTATNVLGIQKGETNLYDYEVIDICKNEKQAYQLMKIRSKEMNLYGMKYKHLEA